jgi:hypothetical protein
LIDMQAVGVDINTKTARDLLRHRPSSRLGHLLVATIKTAIGRMFARQRYDLRDEANKNGFAVPVALRLRDSPATGRDCRCARFQNRFRRASIPRIVQQQRRAFDVELGKCGISSIGAMVEQKRAARTVAGSRHPDDVSFCHESSLDREGRVSCRLATGGRQI